MPARFTLHGAWLSGPTYKVGLMLALSKQPFAYRHVNLREGEHKNPAYVALNRYGQVPCLVDVSDGRAFVQSAVILELLADRLGTFGGADRWERIHAREWMFWDFDRFAPPIYRLRGYKLGFRKMTEETAAMYEAEAKTALGVLDAHLAASPFMVGQAATIADIDLYGVAIYAGDAGVDLTPYPNVTAWMARIEALPGYGRPEAILPKENRD